MTTARPVLGIDVPTHARILPQLHPLAAGLDAAGVGALVLSGDAESGHLHPIHIAASLAPVTSAITLAVRTDAIYVEPFHLATQLAGLDHVSGGRTGWLLEAHDLDEAATAVGRDVLDLEQLETETAEVVEVSRLLWDSWADDAVVRDTASGRYIDASRLQYADFEGTRFSVRGPSITPRSPQGQIPVLLADQDADTAGARVRDDLADGRVLDVHVEPVAEGPAIADAVLAALDTAASADRSARQIRAIRVIGPVADGGDVEPAALAGRFAEAVQALREAEAIAPPPRPGQSLREQLGLPRPEVDIDSARRSDRARLTENDRDLQETR